MAFFNTENSSIGKAKDRAQSAVSSGILDTKLADIVGGLKKYTYNPLGAAALTGAALWGGSKLAYPLVSGALKQVARSMPGSTAEDVDGIDEDMANPTVRRWLPIGIGALGGLGMLLTTADFSAGKGAPKYFGWTRPWGPMHKQGGLNWNTNDQTAVDFSKLVPVKDTKGMILSDPTLQPWQTGELVSMVDDAAARERNNQVSLGGIFDSARDKIGDLLTLKGVTSAAVRGVVGYGMGKAVADSIGTMMDLSPAARNRIQGLGLFGNVINGIIF